MARIRELTERVERIEQILLVLTGEETLPELSGSDRTETQTENAQEAPRAESGKTVEHPNPAFHSRKKKRG